MRQQASYFAGAVLAVIACGVASALTPAPAGNAQAGLAGWPRLIVYALGGIALGLTARGCAKSAWVLPRPRVAWRSDVVLAAGVLLSLAITAMNALKLLDRIADPAGPPLWLLAMGVLFVTALVASPPRISISRRDVTPWLVLLVLLIVGAAVRLPDLATIPLGMNPDEGDRAVVALDVLDGRAPASWFDSGWFFINMIYFRTLAAGLSLFGQDIGGGRMVSALVGIAFLGGLAWLACRNFGWRIGLVTVALATASGLTLQHSRFISEAAPTALLWMLSVAGFLEGARTRRPWGFAVAGLTGGLGLYFYPSARLWAVGAVATVVVIWLFSQRRLELLRGIFVAVAATFVAVMPFLVHLKSNPIEITGRYVQTGVLDPRNQERLPYLSPPEPLPRLLALQFERTLGMFDRYPDGGGFLPTGRPIFTPGLAALVLLSIFFTLVPAWRDPRVAVLQIWLWVGLSGVLLTVESPDVLRAVGILPSLFVLLAVTLVELSDRFLDAANRLRPSGARAVFGWAVPAALAVLVLVTDTVSYFDTFRVMPPGWGPATREGQAVATLGQTGPVYAIEMNEHMVSSGWVRMLAPSAQRGRVPNPGRELPILAPTTPAPVRPGVVPGSDQGLSFLLSGDPNQLTYLDLLYRLYPGGWLDDAGDQRRSYAVSPQALAESRGVRVRSARGLSAPVESFGVVPQTAERPDTFTWSAGVLLARSGEYQFLLGGPPGAQLRVDGVPVQSRIGAARGMHFVEVTAPGEVSLALIGPDGTPRELGPAETFRAMDAPWGLLARIGRPLASALQPPADAYLDATVAMAFFDPELGAVNDPNTVTWSGTLEAPTSGAYRMAFAAEDPMQLMLDGQRVDVMTVAPDRWGGVGVGSVVQVQAGAHAVQVTLQVTHGGRELARWNWVPPRPDGTQQSGSEWAVVPPMVLRPETPVRALPD
jgi:hypothetical protein